METERAGTAVFTTDARMRILAWNDASEALTGIPAAEAIGRPCWDVIRARDRDGKPVCSSDCVVARAVVDGWEVKRREVVGVFPSGPTAVSLASIALDAGNDPTIIHHMHRLESRSDVASTPAYRLTRRQVEILGLLAEGVRVQEIADRLVLAPATVRNHVRAILVALDAHSQLEAVARARLLGVIGEVDTSPSD